MECYRRDKHYRIVHSHFGPILNPIKHYWTPEVRPVKFPPPLVNLPYSSVHEPPWYPPHCNTSVRYGTYTRNLSTMFNYSIIPMQVNEPEHRKADVNRNIIKIAESPEMQEKNVVKSTYNGGSEQKKEALQIDITTKPVSSLSVDAQTWYPPCYKTKTSFTSNFSTSSPNETDKPGDKQQDEKEINKNTSFQQCTKPEEETPMLSSEGFFIENKQRMSLVEEDLISTIKAPKKILDSAEDETALKMQTGHLAAHGTHKDSKMASNKTDDEKFTDKSLPKNSLGTSENLKTKLDSELKTFIPSQLYRMKRKLKDVSDSSLETSSGSFIIKRTSTASTCSDKESVDFTEANNSTRSATPESVECEMSNSSLYITPTSTPPASKTPDVIIGPHIRRCLSDQYSDQSTPNSNLDSSAYYTPESSPSEYRSAKRLRTRWDNSASYISDDSYSLDKSRRSFDLPDEGVIQPILVGYQMVGDSQFCRFGQQLLGLRRVTMPDCPGRIGICVSGQTITDLHRRVKEKFYPISDKIILMIGTNDFLRSVDVMTMCKELSALIRTLQETVTSIVLLTLPPIPKLERKQRMYHFKQLEDYNNYIRSLDNGDNLRVADVSPMYMSSQPYQKCRMYLFELFFSGPARRHDLIHLNRQGLEAIHKYTALFFLQNRKYVKALLFEKEDEQQLKLVEKEVRDYAVRIGINPDTEKHLLKIALDGLMSPLPDDWKPCLDERIDRIYYYNIKTHQTQWSHPLDEHFENVVKRKRHEESISAGDDDSKTSIKEDLKSFEEAVSTSDMMSSRNPLDTHKSRLSSTPHMSLQKTVKEPSSDGRKVLNPIGRPPLPPKRRAGSTSPKRGGLSGSERGSLSLRLSPGSSPTRIDIDSIPITVGAPSSSVKSEKQTTSRPPAIKLTGGGSAFLKSKQKQSPSPSEESKPPPEEPVFEIVREAESIDSPDDDNIVVVKGIEDNKLKHSVSLGESGFDKLTKSKKFTSLQESLLSLKNEMELPKNEPKSPNTSAPLALRGILREKPSPTAKLWDIDPLLLTGLILCDVYMMI